MKDKQDLNMKMKALWENPRDRIVLEKLVIVYADKNPFFKPLANVLYNYESERHECDDYSVNFMSQLKDFIEEKIPGSSSNIDDLKSDDFKNLKKVVKKFCKNEIMNVCDNYFSKYNITQKEIINNFKKIMDGYKTDINLSKSRIDKLREEGTLKNRNEIMQLRNRLANLEKTYNNLSNKFAEITSNDSKRETKDQPTK